MSKIQVYLDNCCFNRPYDNQERLSVKLETEAKIRIQELIKTGELLLIWSFILDYENSDNLGGSKRDSIYEWFNYSVNYIWFNDEIFNNSEKIFQLGFGKKDAIHLSCAIQSRCDYFITVDRGILKKRGKLSEVIIIDPIEFIRKMEE